MESKIAPLLSENRFDYVNTENIAFIEAFDNAMLKRGYSGGDSIGKGYCWGNHMIIYSKVGVTAKKVAARIYMHNNGIILRLFFSNIDKHRTYIESAPELIKSVFMKGHGDCHHCENGHRVDGNCRFRKTYTLDNMTIEKCNGVVFEFWQPTLKKLLHYLALFDEFYPVRSHRK